MRDETLRLLLEVDARYPDRLEYPEGFDWSAQVARVEQLLPLLHRLTGEAFHLDHPQDASYGTGASSTYEIDRRVFTRLGFRFSNFADLFTVWFDGDGHVAPAQVQEVVDAVSREGFVFIDPETAALPLHRRDRRAQRFGRRRQPDLVRTLLRLRVSAPNLVQVLLPERSLPIK